VDGTAFAGDAHEHKCRRDIGVENHPDLDQFLRIEQGQGIVKMGYSRDNMSLQGRVSDDDAIVIPAGTGTILSIQVTYR
jgi:mannose-6-phosphate isomerase-like protein (cupin superfamily)